MHFFGIAIGCWLTYRLLRDWLGDDDSVYVRELQHKLRQSGQELSEIRQKHHEALTMIQLQLSQIQVKDLEQKQEFNTKLLEMSEGSELNLLMLKDALAVNEKYKALLRKTLLHFGSTEQEVNELLETVETEGN
jgi:uncharacterized protein YneF (UPF0154 family)